MLCLRTADLTHGYHALHEADSVLRGANPTWITVTHGERSVLRCLENKPRDRPATAADLAAELRALA